MNNVYDLLEAINQKVEKFFEQEHAGPCIISLSPGSYRRLVELKADSHRVGNLVIGCTAICEFHTAIGVFPVSIDELLSDTEVSVDPK